MDIKKLKVGELLFSKKERMNDINDHENKDSFFPIVQKNKLKKRNSVNFSMCGMRKCIVLQSNLRWGHSLLQAMGIV